MVQLRDEAAALVAFLRVVSVAADVEAAIPEAERDAAEAEKRKDEAAEALADAKETLQAARQALDADERETRESWYAVRPPMQQGGVYDPNAPTPMQTGGVNLDYRPQSRERASLELAAEDAEEAVRRAARELAFAKSEERRTAKRLKALQRHAQVYSELQTPETPTLGLLLNSE